MAGMYPTAGVTYTTLEIYQGTLLRHKLLSSDPPPGGFLIYFKGTLPFTYGPVYLAIYSSTSTTTSGWQFGIDPVNNAAAWTNAQYIVINNSNNSLGPPNGGVSGDIYTYIDFSIFPSGTKHLDIRFLNESTSDYVNYSRKWCFANVYTEAAPALVLPTNVTVPTTWTASDNVTINVGDPFPVETLTLGQITYTHPTLNDLAPTRVDIYIKSGSFPSGIGISAPYFYYRTSGDVYPINPTGNATTASTGSVTIEAKITIESPSLPGQVLHTAHKTKIINWTVNSLATPPIVSITSPSTGSSYYSAQSITFTGTATGWDGAAFTTDLSSTITWSYSGGSLGTGATVSATLPAGTHVITASCDDAGDIGTATVSVVVTASTPVPGTAGDTIESLTLQHIDSTLDNQGVRVQFYARQQGNVNGTYSVRLYRGNTLIATRTGTLNFSTVVGSQDPAVDPAVKYQVVTEMFSSLLDAHTYTALVDVDTVSAQGSINVPDRTPPVITDIDVDEQGGTLGQGGRLKYSIQAIQGLI